MQEEKKKSRKEGDKARLAAAAARLGVLQRRLKDEKIPVIITFDGFDAAGKGLQISRLIQALDPRGFDVYTGDRDGEEEAMHPFLWRFAIRCPERGRIAIFDTSWNRRIFADRFDRDLGKRETEESLSDIRAFEKQLTDDGTVLVRLFLEISEKEQRKRFKKLEASADTAWRVTEADWERNRRYKKYARITKEMIDATNVPWAPWTVIDAAPKEKAALAIMEVVSSAMEAALEKKAAGRETPRFEPPLPPDKYKKGILSHVDLEKTMDREEYRKKLDQLQKRLERLHGDLYRYRIPVVLGFEGWDAAGKGGVIRRLTSHLDPRGYQVCPTASPSSTEKAHHYLWRFWTRFPKDGHIAVFDRTWYGRVMVERIEGFCTEEEWHRAYQEINDMETHLVHSGAVVLKFWLHIDKDEQERRFNDRMKNPEKQWKITDEDWRNREKWDQYEEVVNEMLEKTSTEDAPWIVVEGNSKYYARIKVMETVADALEKKIKEVEKAKKKHE